MLSIVSWNICRRRAAWAALLRMRDEEGVDLALLQEVGKYVPEGVERGGEDWDWSVCDRWPAVVRLSDRVKVEWFEAVPLHRSPQAHEFAVSDIRTIAAAKVTPLQDGQPFGESFIAASMYSFWLTPHPLAGRAPASRKKGEGQVSIYADASVHRVISDLSAFIGHTDPSAHRILAAGDMNMSYGSTDDTLYSMPMREHPVFDRMAGLGLEYIGPQWPDAARKLPPGSGFSDDARNVPTYYTVKQTPETAGVQLDNVFASRGFHESVRVRALNGVDEWGPSDHCRLLLEMR